MLRITPAARCGDGDCEMDEETKTPPEGGETHGVEVWDEGRGRGGAGQKPTWLSENSADDWDDERTLIRRLRLLFWMNLIVMALSALSLVANITAP